MATRLVSADSAPLFALWLLVALVLAVVLAPLLLAALAVRRILRLGRGVLAWAMRRSAVARARSIASHIRTAPSRLGWAVELYQTMMRNELAAMIALADRQHDVRAWFSPTAFWPEVARCRAPHLVCVPDIVLMDAAVDFARLDGAGRFTANLERIEATIGSGRSFTTYSAHVAETVLVQRYHVPAERITVIPHAPVHLDRWVEVRGMPDDAAASRAYCRGQLRSALAKATQPSYAAGFANTEVRFLFYASQFRPSKNVITLLRCYERLLRRHYLGHKLLLTGDPQAIPEIAAFIRERRLQHDVLCLPALTSAELAACYRLAELAVNPSLSEGGCPFTLSEALSVGTPVVMSRIPVTTEVITDPALQELMLFDPRDPADMEERILWGLRHRDELLAAQRPLYRRLEQRTWDHVVEDHVHALEQAVAMQAARS